ncbi:MAG: hypothetical protein EOM74_00290 [Methanomicrobia archaeon]|nr:hypothetical protein [Methanomicrobia archaeon]
MKKRMRLNPYALVLLSFVVIIFIGALFLVVASLFPPIANLLITIPEPVLGGCMLILFGSIAIVGMQMVAEIGFDSKTILVLAISLTLGFGITLVSDFYLVLDSFGFEYLSVIFASPILNMFVISMILSYVIPDQHKKVAQVVSQVEANEKQLPPPTSN